MRGVRVSVPPFCLRKVPRSESQISGTPHATTHDGARARTGRLEDHHAPLWTTTDRLLEDLQQRPTHKAFRTADDGGKELRRRPPLSKPASDIRAPECGGEIDQGAACSCLEVSRHVDGVQFVEEEASAVTGVKGSQPPADRPTAHNTAQLGWMLPRPSLTESRPRGKDMHQSGEKSKENRRQQMLSFQSAVSLRVPRGE